MCLDELRSGCIPWEDYWDWGCLTRGRRPLTRGKGTQKSFWSCWLTWQTVMYKSPRCAAVFPIRKLAECYGSAEGWRRARKRREVTPHLSALASSYSKGREIHKSSLCQILKLCEVGWSVKLKTSERQYFREERQRKPKPGKATGRGVIQQPHGASEKKCH